MGFHDELPPPGPLSTFPAPGLRDIQRNVTTHDENGVGVFLPADNGDHQSVMVNGGALANILYQTDGWPVDMNGDKDVKWAEATEVGINRRTFAPFFPSHHWLSYPTHPSIRGLIIYTARPHVSQRLPRPHHRLCP